MRSGSSVNSSMRALVARAWSGLSSVGLAGFTSCRKKGAPATSSPATPARFQSTLAPSAFRYQAIVASASGTMSITEIAVDGGTKMSSAKSGPPVEYSGQCWWGEPP